MKIAWKYWQKTKVYKREGIIDNKEICFILTSSKQIDSLAAFDFGQTG